MAASKRSALLASPLDAQGLKQLMDSSGFECHLLGVLSRDVTSVSLDSREIEGGACFVATRGAQVDGHEYVASVVSSGANLLVVSQYRWWSHGKELEELSQRCAVLVVPDALQFLLHWASVDLEKRGPKRRIGITGSSGKTTVKDMSHAVLSKRYKTWASPGNMNSVLGLPLAILSMPGGMEVGVFEMAMSEKHEMGRLAAMVRPDLAIITNIGLAHVGNLGSQENIAIEKKAISSCFTGTQTLLIPHGGAYSELLQRDIKGSVVLFGEQVTPGYQRWEPLEGGGQRLIFDGGSIRIGLEGDHIRADVLAVLELGRRFGVGFDSMVEAFAGFTPDEGRGSIIQGPLTIIMDAYNANPDSMLGSYNAFVHTARRGRKVAILGDMFELGELSDSSHQRIIKACLDNPVALVVLLGQAMVHNATALGLRPSDTLQFFPSKEDALPYLEKALEPNDLVLLKASRGMELERLVPHLQSIGKGGRP